GALAGADGLAAVASVGDALQPGADQCSGDACLLDKLGSSAAEREAALVQLGLLTAGPEPAVSDLVQQAAKLRLAGAVRKSLRQGSISTEYRLDEQALRTVLQPGRGAELADAAAAYLGAATVKRGGVNPAAERGLAAANVRGRVASLGAIFDDLAPRYAQLL